MKFNKSNAKAYGRKGGMVSAQVRRERRAFERIINNREWGTYSGYDFIYSLRWYVKNRNWIVSGHTDNNGWFDGIYVGVPNMPVYVYSKINVGEPFIVFRFQSIIYIF